MILSTKRITGIAAAAIAAACTASAQVPQPRPSVAELMAVLQRPEATLHQKARACQQLGEFGTKDAVPALAVLLSDPKLSAYARSGLEGIPDPSAAAAIRAALPKLSGSLLAGALNSLGVLRDDASVDALSALAENPSSGVAKEALLALGRISNEPAIATLRRTLTDGPESLRADAAAGSLHAAEFQLKSGNGESAASLYDAVRSADVPGSYRMAATRGVILARKPASIDLIVTLLRSDDRETRNVALLTLRELQDTRVPGMLHQELGRARPELQVQIIEALADVGNAESLRIIRARAEDGNPDVRRAALKALGTVGSASDAPVLLKAMLDTRNAETSGVASDNLARIAGPEVDRLILEALASATDSASRIALLNVVDARPPVTAATPELLKHAAGKDVNVTLAALRALRSVAGTQELPALIALTKTYQDGSQRAAAETVLYHASTRTADTAPAGELLLAELRQSAEDLDKSSWIKTLAAIGYGKALAAIAPSMRASNSWLVTTTIDNLGKWPDPAPVDELLRFIESTSDPKARLRAIAATMQLATAAAARNNPPAVVPWFKRVAATVRTPEEKRALLTGLSRWRTLESVLLLAPWLNDPQVGREAASAIADTALPVASGPDAAALGPLLQKIADVGGPALTDRIENLRSTIAAAEAAAKRGR